MSVCMCVVGEHTGETRATNLSTDIRWRCNSETYISNFNYSNIKLNWDLHDHLSPIISKILKKNKVRNLYFQWCQFKYCTFFYLFLYLFKFLSSYVNPGTKIHVDRNQEKYLCVVLVLNASEDKLGCFSWLFLPIISERIARPE